MPRIAIDTLAIGRLAARSEEMPDPFDDAPESRSLTPHASPGRLKPMTSTRFSFATASRRIRRARAGMRALDVASMAAYPVAAASRSPGQGPPALR